MNGQQTEVGSSVTESFSIKTVECFYLIMDKNNGQPLAENVVGQTPKQIDHKIHKVTSPKKSAGELPLDNRNEAA